MRGNKLLPRKSIEKARKIVKKICPFFLRLLSSRMKVIGVTGTNGKTSTTFMTKAILEANGIKTGLIGTVKCMSGDKELEDTITTPVPWKLIRIFTRMLLTGCKAVVMEVSSQGLADDRVVGIDFDVAVFTNLTQDHLDIHGTMERYASEKKKLFAQCKTAAFNTDAEYSAYMAEGFSGRMLTYGVQNSADISAQKIEYYIDRTICILMIEQDRYPIEIPIPGEFNVYNLLACVSACTLLGMTANEIVTGLSAIHTIPGRIERIPTPGQPFTVILDYAHTPDGIENILRAVRRITSGRIITVFGCGGKRDKTKRPLMGNAAGRLSDYCIVTSDNPRNEEPMAIIQDILPGMTEIGCQFEVEENRRTAIEKALKLAKEGDVVVLAGKGHEKFQEINYLKYPFDEKLIVQELIQKTNKV